MNGKRLSFTERANHGIIGLKPAPWNDHTDFSWPTEGYDGDLRQYDWDEYHAGRLFAATGHTREEWIALADEMLARWTDYRAHLVAMPEDP